MILDRVRSVNLDGETHDGEPDLFNGADRGRMPVTVVFTTIEGTLAALNAAAHLSQGLGAQIAICVTEVVSFRYLIQGLPDSISFFQRLCTALVNESCLDDVGIEVHLCRDQVECLEARLRPRSIVIIGARRCWWPWRERHLERALNKRGFDALLIKANAGGLASRPEMVVQRMLEQAREITQ